MSKDLKNKLKILQTLTHVVEQKRDNLSVELKNCLEHIEGLQLMAHDLREKNKNQEVFASQCHDTYTALSFVAFREKQKELLQTIVLQEQEKQTYMSLIREQLNDVLGEHKVYETLEKDIQSQLVIDEKKREIALLDEVALQKWAIYNPRVPSQS